MPIAGLHILQEIPHARLVQSADELIDRFTIAEGDYSREGTDLVRACEHQFILITHTATYFELLAQGLPHLTVRVQFDQVYW